MTKSFHREYELIFEAEDSTSVQLTQTFDKIGLAVDFDIQKSKTKGSNQGVFGIMNPGPDTMAIFQKPGIVRFKAGYKGDIATIFVGTKESVSYEDQGGDKRLQLKALEGLTTYTNLQFNKQYGIGSTNLEIISDLTRHLVSNNPAIDSTNLFLIDNLVVYSQPQVLFGNALNILDNFLKPIGYQYFINKGILNILGQNGFIKDLEVFLGPDSGLIGYPKPISDSAENANSIPGVECRSILNYNFDVGRRVRLQSSEYLNKAYVIDTVRFGGSTFDGEYTCDLKMYEADI